MSAAENLPLETLSIAAAAPVDSIDAAVPEIPPEPVLTVATRDDAAGLLGLLRQMHREVGIGILHEGKAVPVGMRMIDDPDCTVFLVKLGNDIIGSAALRLADYMWYSRDLFLVDQWFYVRPGEKRAASALILMNAAKRLSQRLEVPLVLGLLGAGQLERRIRFFDRHGMDRIGGMLVWHPA